MLIRISKNRPVSYWRAHPVIVDWHSSSWAIPVRVEGPPTCDSRPPVECRDLTAMQTTTAAQTSAAALERKQS